MIIAGCNRLRVTGKKTETLKRVFACHRLYPSINCNLNKYALRITTIQEILEPVLDSRYSMVG
jgi:hypothetical protein